MIRCTIPARPSATEFATHSPAFASVSGDRRLRFAEPPRLFPFAVDERRSDPTLRFRRGLAASWTGSIFPFSAVAVSDRAGTRPLQHPVRHSVHFAWGAGGAATLDLARCILIEALSSSVGTTSAGDDQFQELDRLYAEFATTFLERMTHDEWEISVAHVLRWADAHAVPVCRAHRLPAVDGLCGICLAVRERAN